MATIGRFNVDLRLSLSFAACSMSMLLMAGCNWVGWGAHVIGGDQAKTYAVEAEYRGLANKRFAVLVSAGEHTLYAYPHAPLEVCRVVSIDLAMNVQGADPVEPKQIIRFQRDNPYWNSVPYGQLIERLGVDRLVYVDLVEYATHEKGNRYVWRGTIIANIGALEAEAEDPNNFAFWKPVKAQFPSHGAVGLLKADERTIQSQTLTLFAAKVGRLFHDHELTKQR